MLTVHEGERVARMCTVSVMHVGYDAVGQFGEAGSLLRSADDGSSSPPQLPSMFSLVIQPKPLNRSANKVLDRLHGESEGEAVLTF